MSKTSTLDSNIQFSHTGLARFNLFLTLLLIPRRNHTCSCLADLRVWDASDRISLADLSLKIFHEKMDFRTNEASF